MRENMIAVESCADRTLVVYTPTVNKTWLKKGQKLYVDRDAMEQAYYEPSTEYLFREGLLTTDDKTFLEDVGLIEAGSDTPIVTKLEENKLKRMIGPMPLSEFKEEVKKLTGAQIEELGAYAIEHYTELKNDRVDILSKLMGKDILKTISNLKASKED